MKRLGLLALALILALLCGCTEKNAAEPMVADEFRVYASFYPIYALADMIMQDVDGAELQCLVQPQDGCLRSYQLSDWDLALLTASADAVIMGGRGLESFESVAYALGDNGPAVSFVLYDLELMQNHAENADAEGTPHWFGDNPHIYMTVEGAQEIVQRIASALTLLNAENEESYTRNLEKAHTELDNLDREMRNRLSRVQGLPVIVMNEALAYAEDAYGVSVALQYARESGEDITGDTLVACLNRLSGCGAKVILIEKQAPQSLCRALEEAGYVLARMDVLSTRRAEEGYAAYFEAQKANAASLASAFAAAN